MTGGQHPLVGEIGVIPPVSPRRCRHVCAAAVGVISVVLARGGRRAAGGGRRTGDEGNILVSKLQGARASLSIRNLCLFATLPIRIAGARRYTVTQSRLGHQGVAVLPDQSRGRLLPRLHAS
ncbi:hypothetical protein [Sphingomonas sp. PP-CC-1A-547]|uniref:hypothetical protein n=1 Tax=Sphingomonas sp. PP-CC-1A-547 TaxID=2135654 RepID=UPI001042FDDE|nr:hypothetical protein [Sphingomonas sp. PP-CC-1A-547]